MRGSNIEFLSSFSCHIFVEALYDTIAAQIPQKFDNDLEESEVAKLLCHPRNIKLDLILGWDIFNYLKIRTTKSLTMHLRNVCQPDALLYILTSTHPYISATPARFNILDGNYIFHEPSTTKLINNPSYTALAIEKMMTGFQLLHSFILRNGVQEYVFVLK